MHTHHQPTHPSSATCTQELYLPKEQPRASWRAAEQATVAALQQAAAHAPAQVPIPTVGDHW